MQQQIISLGKEKHSSQLVQQKIRFSESTQWEREKIRRQISSPPQLPEVPYRRDHHVAQLVLVYTNFNLRNQSTGWVTEIIDLFSKNDDPFDSRGEGRSNGLFNLAPAKVLDSRQIQRGHDVVPQLLIRWKSSRSDLVSWEDEKFILSNFSPQFPIPSVDGIFTLFPDVIFDCRIITRGRDSVAQVLVRFGEPNLRYSFEKLITAKFIGLDPWGQGSEIGGSNVVNMVLAEEKGFDGELDGESEGLSREIVRVKVTFLGVEEVPIHG